MWMDGGNRHKVKNALYHMLIISTKTTSTMEEAVATKSIK